mgnify:CR=1 FL=1
MADGDYVHAGDVLLKMDLDAIRKEGYETTTMMILTNADDYDVGKGFCRSCQLWKKK